jgi:hypothetical protein
MFLLKGREKIKDSAIKIAKKGVVFLPFEPKKGIYGH